MKKLLLPLLLMALFSCKKENGGTSKPPPDSTPDSTLQQPIVHFYKLRYQVFDSGGSHSDRHNGYSSWSRPVTGWDSLIVDTTSLNPANWYLLIGIDTFRFRDSSLRIVNNKVSGYGFSDRNHITPGIEPPTLIVSNDSFRINYPTYMGVGASISALLIKGMIQH